MGKYICQWCGFTSNNLDDFEFDEQNKDGFWCSYCDGHTFLDEEKNDRRRLLLLLESHGKSDELCSTSKKLKKRLSPLRYPGGKSKIIDFLAELLYQDQLDTFAEAFAGGASVGLALLDAGYTKKLILNDLDPCVYAFWKTVLDSPDSLIRYLDGPLPTHNTYWIAQKIILQPDSYSIDERALAQVICNRLSYSGIVKANPLGGKFGSSMQLLARWNPAQLKNRILHIHDMRNKITVLSMDACDFIEQYAYWDNNATLFVDPPYVKKGQALYHCYFTEDDHRRLAYLLQSLYQGIPGADIIMTYDDCDLIRELYDIADIQLISRCYSI